MKKNLFLAACLTFLSSTCLHAQDIKWSELMKSNGRIASIFPVQGSTFYSTRWSGGALMGSYQLTHHDNFIADAQEKIQNKAGGSVASIERVSIVNGEVVVFLTDKQEGMNRLYMQRYKEDCTPKSEAKMLAEYAIPKGWKKGGYFNVLQSENGQFFCVEYSIPANKEDNERFGFKVMDATTFESISEGEYESEYEAKQSDISNRYISNTGDYFIGVKVYNLNEKGKVKDYTSLEKFLIMHVTEGGVEEVNLDLGDKRILDMTFSSDNNRYMTFNGLYGDKGSSGVKGVFYFQLDFKKQEILNEGYSEFGKDFITQGWSDRQKEKAEKKAAKGKGEPALYNYDIRDNITLADGSLIGTIEQYYVVVSTYYNPQTKSYTTTYTYYYNDLIFYRITPEGEFAWMKKVPKTQVSTNDGGYLSSIASYVTDDNKMVVLFNDNLKNYDEAGDFIVPIGEYVSSASYRKKTNCVARVEMDLESGDFTRKTFFGRGEAEAIAIPKLFNVDYNAHEMLMVLRMGKKEKFGLISF